MVQEGRRPRRRDAQNNLGLLYLNGHGVTRDYAQAMTLFRKSADQNDDAAMDNIGYIYANGLGVQQSWAQAMTSYPKAAAWQRGRPSRPRRSYANEQGVQQDYNRRSRRTEAADQGAAG